MVYMMWFDIRVRTALDKAVGDAVVHYQKMHGRIPNVVVVQEGIAAPGMINGMKLETSPSVLPNHLWVGYQE